MPSRLSVSKKRDEVNCVPLSVVSVKFTSRLPAWKPIQHGLLHRCERVFRPTAMPEIPSHDLPRTAVDHTYQVCPAYGGTCPDLGHVRLPDLIRLGCFHAAPFFLPSCTQTTSAHQQPTFAHHSQYAFAIHWKVLLSS